MQMRKQTRALGLNFANLAPSGFINSGKYHGKKKSILVIKISEEYKFAEY